jgi:hypothetical protein
MRMVLKTTFDGELYPSSSSCLLPVARFREISSYTEWILGKIVIHGLQEDLPTYSAVNIKVPLWPLKGCVYQTKIKSRSTRYVVLYPFLRKMIKPAPASMS